MATVQYVHIHFEDGVTSPSNPNPHGATRSVLLDAFEGEAGKQVRRLRIERDGDCVIATCLRTGFSREYPWSRVRQALRADERCVQGDPRQGPKAK